MLHQYVVFYDGQCPLCVETKQKLEKLPLSGEVEWVPIQQEALEERFSFVHQSDLEKEIHLLVDDTYVYRGYDAMLRLLQAHPLLKIPLKILKVPLIRKIGQKIYATVADRRPSVGRSCDQGICQMGSKQ